MSLPKPGTPQAALNPRYARQHGCAWFDIEPGADLSKAGIWASVGGEPARRLHGVQELDRQVVWWTNLNRAQVWKTGRLDQLKDEHFLGPALPALLSEYGQMGDAASIPLWSETFARLAEWLSNWASLHEPQRPWAWGEGSLAETLAERWAATPGAPVHPQPVLAEAYVETVQHLPLGGPQQWAGRRHVTLSLPRIEHARHMWAERVPAPGEAFTLIQPALMPKGATAGLRWLQEQRQPLLVQVDHINFLPGLEEVGRVWLGLRGRRWTAALVEPIWMTAEEAVDLARLARFEIESAYEAQSWHHEPGPQAWTEEALDSALGPHSTMLGLLGQAAWQALASPTRATQGRQRRAVTPRAVWHRAADRRACFAAARHLVEQGIPVSGYGQGQVTIALDPTNDPATVARLVRQAGLILPRTLAQALPLPAQASPTNPLDVAHWLARAGDGQIPYDLDRLVAPWLDTAEAVRERLRASANRLAGMDLSEVPHWTEWWRSAIKQQLAQTSERLQSSVRRRGRA